MHKKPNILLILTDDQRFDTIGALGNPYVHTPHMDSLVASGTAFERCHIMGGTRPAVCCPSRAMLHSGRNLFHLENHGAQIPSAHTTIGEHLQEHGYRTYGIGKWHNGREAFQRSFTGGGSIYFGGMADHWHVDCNDFDPSGAYREEDRTSRDGQHSTDFCADEAIRLLHEHDQSQPFFMSLNFLAPHDPRVMPERYPERYQASPPPVPENFLPAHPFDNGELRVRDEKLAEFPRSRAEIRRHLSEYYAMIDHLDDALGRVFAELNANNMRENTIIIFSGDNGLAVGQHGLMGKQSCYDHSLRVPLIINGPGIPQGAKRQQLCYLHDVFPTVCSALAIPCPASVTSRSLWPTVINDQPHRISLFGAYKDYCRSVTSDDGWKLIITTPNTLELHRQLFYLPDDPHEQFNRINDRECPDDILNELQEKLITTSTAEQDTWTQRNAFAARSQAISA
jgi:arylsulfatase A-like enzyme